MVKDLIVTVDQEGAKMGVFLTLEPPTKGMVTPAAAAGPLKKRSAKGPKPSWNLISDTAAQTA
jgi:hypothetical protein